MTPEQIKEAVCRDVCLRFVNEGKSTSRRQLAVRYRNTEVLRDLTDRGFLRDNGTGTRLTEDLTYVPRLGAFVLSGDVGLLELVTHGMVAAVSAVQQLFFDLDPGAKLEFSLDDVFKEAQKSHPCIDRATIRLGLMFAGEHGAWGGYTQNEEHTEIARVFVNDHIVDIHSPDRWVNEHIERFRQVTESRPNSAADFMPTLARFEEMAGYTEQHSSGFDWNLLHRDVQRIARERFESGYFADAVEASLKAINEQLQLLYRKERGQDRDGAALMTEVFSCKTPLLLLGDLNTITGESMQKGYMQIFAGAMTGIRNPKAHGNVEIDANRATHFLFLASLLMWKIDEALPARSVEQPPKTAF